SDSARVTLSKEKTSSLAVEGEEHLSNIVQLTFGGENAEAYFSTDASELILQSTIGERKCDAIYRMNSDGSNTRLISSGKGVTTCAFIAPDGKSVIYASTHLGGADCPPKPDHSRGYVWALYKDYDIFAADPDGANLRRLTDAPGYDAECVYSAAGDKIIFTSARDGDLELYTMNPDGTEQTRITNAPGYDGGAFFSYDGKKIVWRASRPTGEALEDYRALLKEGLIRPSKLEIFIANTDGSSVKRLTNNGKANFGPYWHPSGNYIIFASNVNDPKGRNFDLFTVHVDTGEVEQITFNPTFDGFPMFSHDGKKLVFASNRNNKAPRETNVFIADWVE
ncbi:MAG: TolB family protein, partial [Candidatus Zixiibacteriota bacterium]